MSKKTLIFIPTYNERENVGPMCEQILALGLDADLMFMDDGSPDGTGAALDELAAKHRRVLVAHRTAKLGIGTAHQAGINYAYDNGYERLVTLDCDFTHSPALIPTFMERGETSDVVVGTRFARSGSLPGWTLVRRSLTALGHFMTETLLGMTQDATGAFRVYDLRRIPRELFGLVESKGYSFFFESLFILNKNGFSIAEIPITLAARTQGSSKMGVGDVRRSVERLFTVFAAEQSDPRRFRLPSAGFDIDPSVGDADAWNRYWEAQSAQPPLAYAALSTLYRNAVTKRRVQNMLQREFPAGAALLHAGCGAGKVDSGLHQHAKITAIDISTAALELYQRENPRAEVRHASVTQLPFADRSFDGAYNLGMIEHLEEQDFSKALHEIGRVLKPGGKYVAFWPHGGAVSAMKPASFVLNEMRRGAARRPPTRSAVSSADEARSVLGNAGLDLTSYYFGPKDLFVNAVVVATKH